MVTITFPQLVALVHSVATYGLLLTGAVTCASKLLNFINRL